MYTLFINQLSGSESGFLKFRRHGTKCPISGSEKVQVSNFADTTIYSKYDLLKAAVEFGSMVSSWKEAMAARRRLLKTSYRPVKFQESWLILEFRSPLVEGSMIGSHQDWK